MPVSGETRATIEGWIADAEKRAAQHHRLERRYNVVGIVMRLGTTVCSSVLGGSEFVRFLQTPLQTGMATQLEALEQDRASWQTVVGIVFASLTLTLNAVEHAIGPGARYSLHHGKRLAYENFAREARLGMATFDTVQAEKGLLEQLENQLSEIASMK